MATAPARSELPVMSCCQEAACTHAVVAAAAMEATRLSDKEREIILGVLAKDERLRRDQQIRVLHLKAELQTLRRRGALRACADASPIQGSCADGPVDGPGTPATVINNVSGVPFIGGCQEGAGERACGRCRAELGRVINRGAYCRACRLRVCKQCRQYSFRTTDWVCTVCHKRMEIQAASGEWMNEFVRRPSRRRDNRVYVPAADIIKRTIRRSWTISNPTPRWWAVRGSPEFRPYSSLPRDQDAADYPTLANLRNKQRSASHAVPSEPSPTFGLRRSPTRRTQSEDIYSERGASPNLSESSNERPVRVNPLMKYADSRRTSPKRRLKSDDSSGEGSIKEDGTEYDKGFLTPEPIRKQHSGGSIEKRVSFENCVTGKSNLLCPSPGPTDKSMLRSRSLNEGRRRDRKVPPPGSKSLGDEHQSDHSEEVNSAREESGPLELCDIEPLSGTVFRKVTVRRRRQENMKKMAAIDGDTCCEVLLPSCDDYKLVFLSGSDDDSSSTASGCFPVDECDWDYFEPSPAGGVRLLRDGCWASPPWGSPRGRRRGGLDSPVGSPLVYRRRLRESDGTATDTEDSTRLDFEAGSSPASSDGILHPSMVPPLSKPVEEPPKPPCRTCGQAASKQVCCTCRTCGQATATPQYIPIPVPVPIPFPVPADTLKLYDARIRSLPRAVWPYLNAMLAGGSTATRHTEVVPMIDEATLTTDEPGYDFTDFLRCNDKHAMPVVTQLQSQYDLKISRDADESLRCDEDLKEPGISESVSVVDKEGIEVIESKEKKHKDLQYDLKVLQDVTGYFRTEKKEAGIPEKSAIPHKYLSHDSTHSKEKQYHDQSTSTSFREIAKNLKYREKEPRDGHTVPQSSAYRQRCDNNPVVPREMWHKARDRYESTSDSTDQAENTQRYDSTLNSKELSKNQSEYLKYDPTVASTVTGHLQSEQHRPNRSSVNRTVPETPGTSSVVPQRVTGHLQSEERRYRTSSDSSELVAPTRKCDGRRRYDSEPSEGDEMLEVTRRRYDSDDQEEVTGYLLCEQKQYRASSSKSTPPERLEGRSRYDSEPSEGQEVSGYLQCEERRYHSSSESSSESSSGSDDDRERQVRVRRVYTVNGGGVGEGRQSDDALPESSNISSEGEMEPGDEGRLSHSSIREYDDDMSSSGSADTDSDDTGTVADQKPKRFSRVFVVNKNQSSSSSTSTSSSSDSDSSDNNTDTELDCTVVLNYVKQIDESSGDVIPEYREQTPDKQVVEQKEEAIPSKQESYRSKKRRSRDRRNCVSFNDTRRNSSPLSLKHLNLIKSESHVMTSKSVSLDSITNTDNNSIRRAVSLKDLLEEKKVSTTENRCYTDEESEDAENRISKKHEALIKDFNEDTASTSAAADVSTLADNIAANILRDGIVDIVEGRNSDKGSDTINDTDSNVKHEDIETNAKDIVKAEETVKTNQNSRGARKRRKRRSLKAEESHHEANLSSENKINNENKQGDSEHAVGGIDECNDSSKDSNIDGFSEAIVKEGNDQQVTVGDTDKSIYFTTAEKADTKNTKKRKKRRTSKPKDINQDLKVSADEQFADEVIDVARDTNERSDCHEEMKESNDSIKETVSEKNTESENIEDKVTTITRSTIEECKYEDHNLTTTTDKSNTKNHENTTETTEDIAMVTSKFEKKKRQKKKRKCGIEDVDSKDNLEKETVDTNTILVTVAISQDDQPNDRTLEKIISDIDTSLSTVISDQYFDSIEDSANGTETMTREEPSKHLDSEISKPNQQTAPTLNQDTSSETNIEEEKTVDIVVDDNKIQSATNTMAETSDDISFLESRVYSLALSDETDEDTVGSEVDVANITDERVEDASIRSTESEKHIQKGAAELSTTKEIDENTKENQTTFEGRDSSAKFEELIENETIGNGGERDGAGDANCVELMLEMVAKVLPTTYDNAECISKPSKSETNEENETITGTTEGADYVETNTGVVPIVPLTTCNGSTELMDSEPNEKYAPLERRTDGDNCSKVTTGVSSVVPQCEVADGSTELMDSEPNEEYAPLERRTDSANCSKVTTGVFSVVPRCEIADGSTELMDSKPHIEYTPLERRTDGANLSKVTTGVSSVVPQCRSADGIELIKNEINGENAPIKGTDGANRSEVTTGVVPVVPQYESTGGNDGPTRNEINEENACIKNQTAGANYTEPIEACARKAVPEVPLTEYESSSPNLSDASAESLHSSDGDGEDVGGVVGGVAVAEPRPGAQRYTSLVMITQQFATAAAQAPAPAVSVLATGATTVVAGTAGTQGEVVVVRHTNAGRVGPGGCSACDSASDVDMSSVGCWGGKDNGMRQRGGDTHHQTENVTVITGSETLSAFEEGLADDDSWVENLSHDDEDTPTEDSSSGEEVTLTCSAAIDQEDELRGYHRSAIDFTLHTILEDSCEGEESEVEQTASRRKERPASATDLEKYFFFGLGDGIATSLNSNRDDALSETSSIYSEGVESLGGMEDTQQSHEADPADLASSRLEKYFLSGFMGFTAERRDSDGSVGSDSEGRPSPEQRRKRLVRARGTGRSHSSSLDNLDNAGNEQTAEPQINSEDSSSSDSDAYDDVTITNFEKSDGQFDTIKRKKGKKHKNAASPADESKNLETTQEVNEDENELDDEDPRNKTPQPEPMPTNLTTNKNQQSRDSGFIGSCDDLLKDQRDNCTPDLPTKAELKIELENIAEERIKTDERVPSLSTPPATSLTRKDSFNNWSSDEETNLMMCKMRQFFKTMVANSQCAPNSKPTTPNLTLRTSPKPVGKGRCKPPQLVYFENELTRLMKTVPGIKDEQVREIVEYLSSEDTWSDSYDSSDYTSSDLEGASTKSALQQQISDSCKQIINKFDNRIDDEGDEGDGGIIDESHGLNKETAFVYQKLMASFEKMATGDSETVNVSKLPAHGSPPLIAKVMHHIGSRLVALMHEVSSGESHASNSPKTKHYHKRLQHKISSASSTTTEDDLPELVSQTESRANAFEDTYSLLPRSRSHDLLDHSHQSGVADASEEREASDCERFSWRGSFESALLATDSRNKLSLLGSEGSASASALAIAAKRRSAGDLLFSHKSLSREQLDRVRSCGSIGGANSEDKLWTRPNRRRSSVPDATSCGSGGSADGEDEDEDMDSRSTLPRSLQSVAAQSTNSLPRLPTNATAAMQKSQSMYQFLPQNVKSARYRPPGLNRLTSVPKRAVSAPGLQPSHQRRGRRSQQVASDDVSLNEPPRSPCATPIGSSKSATPSPVATAANREWHTDDDIDRLLGIHTRTSLSSLGVRSESLASVYSGAGGEGRYGAVTVRGQVEFGLQYNYKASALEIQVRQCRDLAPVDAKRNRSDPYVKVYLLPDKSKSGKRKTKVKKHTLNPIFHECLKFHISLNELETRTLWLTVWHSDMFGRNDFLGEVMMTLENKVFDDPTPRWYQLQERTEPFEDVQSYKGDIIVCLKFIPPDMTSHKKKRSRGALHVLVKEAKSLTGVKANGTSDPFCKSYLLPDKGRSSKQKTPMARRTVNPVWNHTFVYDDVTLQELAERCLELTVWDHDRLGSNEFLGGVRFSLGTGKHYGKSVDWMDASGKELSLWKSMLERPNFWVEGCLQLRPSLDSRVS